MSLKPNPIDGLLSFQYALNTGMAVRKLDADYVERFDEIVGGVRFCYAKVIAGQVQSLATFGSEEAIHGVDCFSVNYSVDEKFRGRGLAIEIVGRGIEEIKRHLRQSNKSSFYVDAIIETTNSHSIKVAGKLFSKPGVAMTDHISGVPSLYFRRLIRIQ